MINGKESQIHINHLDGLLDRPLVVATSPYKPNYFQDHVFWFNKKAHQEMVKEDPFVVLDNMIHNSPVLVSSHSGWYRYMQHFGFSVVVCLQEIMSRKFWDTDHTEEFAKKWKI
jgi:hypothetical protein